MKKLFLILTVVSICAFSAFAEGAENNEDSKDADLFVNVTAARELKETESIPAAVTVITAEDMEGHSVTEALSIYAGIGFSPTYGDESVTGNPVLRGFSDNSIGRVLVMVDGVKLNNPDMSGINWLSIPEERIDRIEVVKGGNSALYGNNAVAVVINVITKTPEKGMKGSVDVFGGSFSSYGGAVSVSGNTDIGYLDVSAERDKSDGWRDRTGYESTDFSAKAGLKAVEKLDTSLSFNYSNSEYEMPGSLTEAQYKDDPTDAFNKEDFAENIFAQVNSSSLYELNELTDIDLTFSYSNKKVNADMVSWMSYTDTEVNTVTVSPSVKIDFPGFLWGSSLMTGLDYSNDKLNKKFFSNEDRDTKTDEVDLLRNTFGAFTRAESYVFENLVLSLSARYESSKLEAEFSDSSLDDDKTHSPIVYGAGVSYIFAEDSKVYISYNKLFRYPFFDEQVNYNGMSNGYNTDLDPEKGNDFEFGVEYNVLTYVQGGVNFFCLFMEDEIAPNASFVNENMDDTLHYGAETYVNVNPLDIFTTRINYNYTVAKFTKGDKKDNDIPMTPAHSFSIIPELKLLEMFKVYAEFTYNGEMYEGGDFNNEFDKMDSYFLTNAGLSASKEYKNTDINIYLDVKNLFDTDYVPYIYYNGFSTGYYPGAGREITVGTKLSF